MSPSEEAAVATQLEEIKPYKIHVSFLPRLFRCLCFKLLGNHTNVFIQPKVSSKYLDLTRQKLTLARLPHEAPQVKQTEWWEPKPTVEPLIDFW